MMFANSLPEPRDIVHPKVPCPVFKYKFGSTPYSNLYLNTGHGTLGWTMSLGSGKLLANIISGIDPEISMEGIDMSRFNYANKTLLNYG